MFVPFDSLPTLVSGFNSLLKKFVLFSVDHQSTTEAPPEHTL